MKTLARAERFRACRRWPARFRVLRSGEPAPRLPARAPGGKSAAIPAPAETALRCLRFQTGRKTPCPSRPRLGQRHGSAQRPGQAQPRSLPSSLQDRRRSLSSARAPNPTRSILTLAENLYLAYDVQPRLLFRLHARRVRTPGCPLSENRRWPANIGFIKPTGFSGSMVFPPRKFSTRPQNPSSISAIDPKSDWALRNHSSFFPLEIYHGGIPRPPAQYRASGQNRRSRIVKARKARAQSAGLFPASPRRGHEACQVVHYGRRQAWPSMKKSTTCYAEQLRVISHLDVTATASRMLENARKS